MAFVDTHRRKLTRPLCIIYAILIWILIYTIVVLIHFDRGSQVDDVTSVVRKIDESVYKERLEYIRGHCEQSQKGHVDKVYLHNHSKLAYCPVAKIGSTFWKRVFLFLHNDTGRFHVQTPFEIPRVFVHYGKKMRTQVLQMNSTTEKILEDYKRFMFVRDPYTRLWSAYLDKFYLPDFWRTFALVITRNRPQVTEKAQRCGNDVSFQEFLEYVASLAPEKMNEHWQPIKYRCDPCKFKPDIIGKQETFADDSKYILQVIGQDWIMDTFDYNTHAEEEISMLVDYNFNLITRARRFYESCTDKVDIAKRLWKVFQINGYLPFDQTADDAVRELSKQFIDKDIFKYHVLKKYRKYPSDVRKSFKSNRLTAIQKAYGTISKPLLDNLKKIFQGDFETFGYNTQPPE